MMPTYLTNSFPFMPMDYPVWIINVFKTVAVLRTIGIGIGKQFAVIFGDMCQLSTQVFELMNLAK